MSDAPASGLPGHQGVHLAREGGQQVRGPRPDFGVVQEDALGSPLGGRPSVGVGASRGGAGLVVQDRPLWRRCAARNWSTVTASTLLRLPPTLRREGTDRLAEAILRANMANYRGDGSATCAFVLPSTVDGRPAHTAAPRTRPTRSPTTRTGTWCCGCGYRSRPKALRHRGEPGAAPTVGSVGDAGKAMTSLAGREGAARHEDAASRVVGGTASPVSPADTTRLTVLAAVAVRHEGIVGNHRLGHRGVGLNSRHCSSRWAGTDLDLKAWPARRRDENRGYVAGIPDDVIDARTISGHVRRSFTPARVAHGAR